MKKTVRVTDKTNAVVIWGKVHVFHYTNKPVDCNHCSLRGYCATYDGVFGHVCKQFKFWWNTYKNGFFKEYKGENSNEYKGDNSNDAN